MDFLNVKQQLVELPVITGSNLSQFKFPTQDFLRQKYIVSIEAYCDQDITFAPTGNVLPTGANLQTSFLTLYGQNPEQRDQQGIESSGDGQWLELIPLIALHRTQGITAIPFVRGLYGMVPRVIIWEKSYVSLGNGQTLGNEAPVSYCFLVGYIGNAGDAKG